MHKLTCGWAPPSLHPLDVAHMMNAPRPTLFSHVLLFHVLLSTQNEEQKQGRPGNELMLVNITFNVNFAD